MSLHAHSQVAELHRLVSEGIASGEVTPLPFTAFSGARVQDAFEYLVPGERIPTDKHPRADWHEGHLQGWKLMQSRRCVLSVSQR